MGLCKYHTTRRDDCPGGHLHYHGYDDGYDDGYLHYDGYNVGYDDGDNDGYDVGYLHRT